MINLWPLILPLLILLPGLAAFPFPTRDAPYSDFAISHYPNAVFLRWSLLEWHTLPLWSSTILSGYPFAANPLSGLWYLPGWLALVFPLPWGINFVLLLHWLFAGVGLYWLLRAERLIRPAALFGALAFVALPKLFAHYGAGHVTLLYAVSWTPWLLLSARSWLTRPRGDGYSGLYARLGWALPSIMIAMILLADVRWSVFAGILLLGYGIALQGIARGKASLSTTSGKSFLRLCGTFAGWIGLAVLLAAPLLAPMLEYTLLSTRKYLQAQEALVFSLPPGRLLGLLFPDLAGFQEFTLYSGIVVLELSILALLCRSSRKRAAFWALSAVFGLVIALGENLPLAPALVQIPFLSWLRVPSRALFVTGMSLAALSAWGMHAILSSPSLVERKRGFLFLVGLASFTFLLAGMVRALTGKIPSGFAWSAAVSLLGAVWIGLKLKEHLTDRAWTVGVFTLCLIDLLFVDLSLFEPRLAQQVLSEGAQAAEYLRMQPGEFRTYSPSYSLPQQTGAIYDIRQADGVDPLQLQAYVQYMGEASGVPASGYSVTLPPYASGDPKNANQAYTPDARLLGRLNVAYVLAEYDLDADGLRLLQRFGETRLYENLYSMPRLWVAPPGDVTGANFTNAVQMEWSPNHVLVQAEGPGILTLSEINYPGWQALLDGKRIDAYAGETLLRAVNLPAGTHTIEWTFRPNSIFIGLALAVLGLFLIGVLSLLPGWKQPEMAPSSGTISADQDDRAGMAQ